MNIKWIKEVRRPAYLTHIKILSTCVLIIISIKIRNYHLRRVGLLGCRFKANSPLVGPGPIGSVPSAGVFLKDPSPNLHEFRRMPRKTPNSYVNKRDWGLNLAPPVFQFWALPLRHWWGPKKCGNLIVCLIGDKRKKMHVAMQWIKLMDK